jgi:hypothetical protein
MRTAIGMPSRRKMVARINRAGGRATMDVLKFKATWRGSTLKESAFAKPHFIDLCRALGMPTPADEDQTGAFYTFEKGATKTEGGEGFADVWYRGHFAWEYKGPGGDLVKAYTQLKQYVEALENPPLLVVSDNARFEIHTNFTNTKKEVHRFTIDEIDAPAAPGELSNLQKLTALWTDPEALRPLVTPDVVTKEAAAKFGAIAASLRDRGHAPQAIAHYLMQLLFCLFAEDTGALPRGLFTELLKFGAKQPVRFQTEVGELLRAMAGGGFFAMKEVVRFNGGLFLEIDPLPLTSAELTTLAEAAALDWTGVEPAIFGTLFERSLDPGQRAQLGAHYTGKADILRVVEPVVMTPLRRRWDEVRAEAEAKRAEWIAASTPGTAQNRKAEFAAILARFQGELKAVRILDPACGSGNFLYVALERLLSLEKEVLVFGAANGLPLGYPGVEPGQLHGLEINEYARELAQVVVWIGYLKWKLDNGFPGYGDPVLAPLETIRLQDALLDLSDPDHPKEAEWPAADFIIGNPPFLGGNRVRGELGDNYLEHLFGVYEGRVPAFADLVCYFFERARVQIERLESKRAGLLATNSIRGGVNRKVLERIKVSGDIFLAWSDEPWILDGAAVRISIVGFDYGQESNIELNGHRVQAINADLTHSADIASAVAIKENARLCFLGIKKGGAFELTEEQAAAMLAIPKNPNGRSNRDVVRPYVNGSDLLKRSRNMWIVDFGVNMSEQNAALYEAPFEYVLTHVKPIRDKNRRERRREFWWLFSETAPGMRAAISKNDRQIVTSRVSKYRMFVWQASEVICDDGTVTFARQDDYFFGVLHSRAHEVWSLRMGTSLEDRPRYTPTTCFETFPLPWSPGGEPWRDERLHAIAAAANALDEARSAWLNPPDASEAELKKRTLTNLYNARPTWLANLHAALDRAVWAAYGWDDDPAATTDEQILERLLALNGERAATQSSWG